MRLRRRSLIYRRPAHCAWPWTSYLFARVRAVSEKSRNEAPRGLYLANKQGRQHTPVARELAENYDGRTFIHVVDRRLGDLSVARNDSLT